MLDARGIYRESQPAEYTHHKKAPRPSAAQIEHILLDIYKRKIRFLIALRDGVSIYKVKTYGRTDARTPLTTYHTQVSSFCITEFPLGSAFVRLRSGT